MVEAMEIFVKAVLKEDPSKNSVADLLKSR
jgi:hypothetical protein